MDKTQCDHEHHRFDENLQKSKVSKENQGKRAVSWKFSGTKAREVFTSLMYVFTNNKHNTKSIVEMPHCISGKPMAAKDLKRFEFGLKV